MSDCGFHCYEIGGGFIAENPECPIHRDGGINDRLYALEAELAAERERADRNQEDAERWNLLCELWHASTELSLMQEEDGRWSIKQVEDIDGEMFYQLWGDTPDAAIDAARRK